MSRTSATVCAAGLRVVEQRRRPGPRPTNSSRALSAAAHPPANAASSPYRVARSVALMVVLLRERFRPRQFVSSPPFHSVGDGGWTAGMRLRLRS